MNFMGSIASLFSARPPRASKEMRFRQGVVVSFDQNTLENVINVDGALLEDLPLLGVGEATTLQAGDVVGLIIIGEEGSQTWAILGQLVAPNTQTAFDAVALLNQQIFAATIGLPAQTISTGASFVDLATAGPSVTVNVGPSGRLLVIMTAQYQANLVGFVAQRSLVAEAAPDFSGANTISAATAASTTNAKWQYFLDLDGATNSDSLHVQTVTAHAVFDALSTGSTTIKMMYRSVTGSQAVEVHRRTLTVIKL